MKEFVKYLIRTVSITGLIGIVSLLFTGILYGIFFKLLIAIAVAEILWAFWFKPFIGAIENVENPIKFAGILFFRAVLLGSCITGACLGL